MASTAQISKPPEKPPDLIRVRCGSVIGEGHIQKHFNNQDAYMSGMFEFENKRYFFGAVFDGCTGKKGSHTEVGANLLASWLRSEIPFLISAHIPMEEIPQTIYDRTVAYMGSIARLSVSSGPAEMSEYVQRYLFCTIIGFIMDEEEIITFAAGDGLIVWNDNVTVIDQNNAPLYPAYHLIDRSILGDLEPKLPKGFKEDIFSVRETARFAVITDGLTKPLQRDASLLDGFFEWEREHPSGLQWFLNVQARQNKVFSDDCTAVTLERTPGEPGTVIVSGSASHGKKENGKGGRGP